MCEFIHVEAKRSTLGIFLTPLFFQTGLSLSLKPANLARPADYQVPGILLSPQQ